RLRDEPAYQFGYGINRLDAIVHEKDLSAALKLKLDSAADDGFRKLYDVGLYRQSVSRRGFDDRKIPEAGERHVQGARDRGGRHSYHIDFFAHLFDAFLVRYAEALFFVNDEQAKVFEPYVFRQNPVGADNDIDRSRFNRFDDLFLLSGGSKLGKHFDAHGEGAEPVLKSLKVLIHENGCGRKQSDLFTFHNGFESGPHGHFRLAVAHIPDDEAVHRIRAF